MKKGAKKTEAQREPEWLTRVRMEKVQLDEKLGRLKSFVATPEFKGIDGAQKKLMLKQAELMQGYSDVLGIRLDAAAKK